MTKGKSRKKTAGAFPWKTALIALAAVAFVGLGIFAGYGYSKYLTEKRLEPKVTIDSKLVKTSDGFQLWEHSSAMDPTGAGEYTLSASETKSSNEYLLIPGTTIPKDPFIVITGKTEIPAYLYVEVVEADLPDLMVKDTFDDAIDAETAPADERAVTFELTSDWTLVKDGDGNPVRGYHGGSVYVWKNGTIIQDLASTTTVTEGDGTYQILKNNAVVVTTHRPVGSDENPYKLDFYGYLLQTLETGVTNGTPSYQTYLEVFTSNIQDSTAGN